MSAAIPWASSAPAAAAAWSVDEDRLALAVDGVVLGAAVEGHERRVAGGHEALDDAGHEQVAVAALEVDVGAGVAAEQAGDLEREGAAACVLAGHRARVGRHDAAGAAHRGNALLLGVEVDHDAGVDLGLVERLGAHEAGLLVRGEHALEGGMDQRVVVEDREHEGDRDAVVGTERGAVGAEHAVLHDQVDALVLGNHARRRRAVAHHVDMALEHDRGSALRTGARWLLDDHVVHVVLIDPQVALLGERDEEVADGLLVARAARNRASSK